MTTASARANLDVQDEDAGTAPAHGRRGWMLDASVLAVVALLLRVPAFFAPRSLVFDDGVYGMSAVAMRHGQLPFIDVFSSQGPLHLPLLYVADLLGFRTLDGTRVLPVAAGIVATVAAYAVARRLGTRPAAWLVALLVTTSGSVLAVTGPITADGTALAFALLALLAALRYHEQPTTGRAVVVGVLAGAGLAVKALMAPVGIPIALLMISRRDWRRIGIAACSTVGVVVLSALPWGLGRVWDQSVVYHGEVERSLGLGGNVRKVLSTLFDRDPAVLVAVLLVIVLGVCLARGWPDPPPDPIGGDPLSSRFATLLLGTWIVAQFGFLVAESGLWRAHVVHLVAPLALLVAVFAVRTVTVGVVAVAALVVFPFQAMHAEYLWNPQPYSGRAAEVMRRLEALPAGAEVISDEPGFPWRAQRDIPVRYVDTSFLRLDQGRITTDDIIADARRRSVCAVVVWGRTHFATLRDLPERLERLGYERDDIGPGAVYYSKPDCRP